MVVLRFDRGSIEFEGLTDANSLPVECELVFDARVQRFRSNAAEHERVSSALRKMGLRVDDRVLDPLPVADWREVPLRDYQRAALSAWEQGARRGLVVLPTGAGKTRVAIAAMKNRGAALVIVPTRVLLQQWRTEIGEFYSGAVGVIGDGSHDLRGVTVATYVSGRRYVPSIGNRFDLLVVDEAHHFGDSVWDELLEMCTAAARLGLTATPPSGQRWHRLSQSIGPVRFEMNVDELVGTHLPNVNVIRVSLDLHPEERRRYDEAKMLFSIAYEQFCAVTPGANWREFIQASRLSHEGRKAIRAWHRARKIAAWSRAKRVYVSELLQRHRGQQVLVFAYDNDCVYDIARRHWVMPITCDLGRRERESALDAFRRGEIKTLVSARVLNEGVDVPAASVGILVGGAQGSREFVQRVGRVLRPAGGKSAIVYDLVTSATSEVGQANRRVGVLGPNASRSVYHP